MVKINLEKVEERWWEAVLVDEPKISVRKIDPSRPMTDLDNEAQAKIEELMYNEHQKRLGLPQSHEKVCSALYVYMFTSGVGQLRPARSAFVRQAFLHSSVSLCSPRQWHSLLCYESR